jgi:hypothetical protein
MSIQVSRKVIGPGLYELVIGGFASVSKATLAEPTVGGEEEVVVGELDRTYPAARPISLALGGFASSNFDIVIPEGKADIVIRNADTTKATGANGFFRMVVAS